MAENDSMFRTETTERAPLEKTKSGDKQVTSNTQHKKGDGYFCINFWNRNLSSLPKRLYSIIAVEWLNLCQNRLNQIPSELCSSLINIQYLYASFNQITTIPMDIRFLHELKELVLDHNLICSVPKELFWCTNITHLYLPFNQFYWLPKDICNLKQLKVLSLSYNNLVTLPFELSTLPNLSFIHIKNNPFAVTTLDELAPNTPKNTNLVLNYLSTQLKQQQIQIANLKADKKRLKHDDNNSNNNIENNKNNMTNEEEEEEEEEEDSEDEEDEIEVYEWLKVFELDELYDQIVTIGVEEIEDIHYLQEQDLETVTPVNLRDKLLNIIYKNNAFANNNKYSIYQN